MSDEQRRMLAIRDALQETLRGELAKYGVVLPDKALRDVANNQTQGIGDILEDA